MNLLALDTSSIACSVALQSDDSLVARHVVEARQHTQILMPMIREVLDTAKVRLEDLDAIVLGNGPGSFIGMRIAASVAQGLAHAAALDIVPVSSLATIAAEVFENHDAGEVVVTQDAHMHEVYLGMYACGDAGTPLLCKEERLHDLSAIGELDSNSRGRRLGAGYGWQRYPELRRANQTRIDRFVDVEHPNAAFALGIGAERLQHGESIRARQVEPAYLRQKVASKPAP